MAEQANAAAKRISSIFEADAQKISNLKRAAMMARKVHEVMRQRPIVTIALISELCDTTVPTATNALRNLEKLGIVLEVKGKERGRIYAYTKYLEVLDEGPILLTQRLKTPKITDLCSKRTCGCYISPQNQTLRERGITLIERPSRTLENEFFSEFNTFR